MSGSATLATAYIQLVPTLKGVKGQIEQEFGAVDTAAEKAGKSSGSKFSSGLKGAIGPVAGVMAGMFAAGAVTNFISSTVTALSEIERLSAQTGSVIKATGGAAGVTTKHIEDLAGSLEAMTSTEAEAVQTGANFLLTFKNIRNEAGAGNDVFDQTTTAMVDMARATGQDMQGAALQLGKALNDPIKGISALSRVGVGFTEQQKAQIEAMQQSGDIMGAQKIILAELNSQFGGSGAAYLQTYAGQVEQLGHQWGTLGETVIGAFMPAAKGGVSSLVQLMTSINEVVTPERVTAALDTVKGAFGTLVTAVTPFAKAFASAFSGVGSQLAPLGKQLLELWMNFSPLSLAMELLEPLLPQLAQAFGTIGTALSGGLATILPILSPLMTQLMQTIQPLISMLITALVPVLASVVQAWAELAGGLLGAVMPVITQLAAGVLPQLLTMVTSLFPVLWDLTGALLPIGDAVIALVPVILQVVQLALPLLLDAINMLLPVVIQLVDQGLSAVVDILLSLMPVILQIVQQALPPLMAIFAALVPIITQVIMVVAQIATQLISILVPIIVNLVQAILPPLLKVFGLVVEAALSIVAALMPVIQTILSLLIPAINILMPIVTVLINILGVILVAAINVVMAIFQGLVWVITNVVVPIALALIETWVAVASGVIAAVTWLKDGAVALWQALIDGIMFAWNTWIVPFFEGIRLFVTETVPGWFTSLKDGATTTWNNFLTGLMVAWDVLIKPFFDSIKTFMMDTLPGWFRDGVAAIGGWWGTLEDKAKKPVKFLVQTVLNDGVLKAFNAVAGTFGITKLQPITLGFASGGIVPGQRTPGYDNQHYVSLNGGPSLSLSGGELIGHQNLVSALGGPGAAKSLNDISRSYGPTAGRQALASMLGDHHAHAGGGIIDWLGEAKDKAKGVVTGGLDWIKDKTADLGDILTNPGKVLTALVNKILGNVPDEGFSQLLAAIPRKLAEAAGNVLGVRSDPAAGGGAAAVGPGDWTGAGPAVWRHMGWKAMVDVARQVVPSMQFTSGYRPGARVAAGGRQSNHALGYAIDLASGSTAAMSQAWDTLNALYGNQSLQLLYSPKGSAQVYWDGRRSDSDPITKSMHYNHLHWAMNQGGLLPPIPAMSHDPKLAESFGGIMAANGMLPDMATLYDTGGWLDPGRHLVENKTPRSEAVLTGPQWDIASAAIDHVSHGDIAMLAELARIADAFEAQSQRPIHVTIGARDAGDIVTVGTNHNVPFGRG